MEREGFFEALLKQTILEVNEVLKNESKCATQMSKTLRAVTRAGCRPGRGKNSGPPAALFWWAA
jgi:hypothetical protein